MNDIIFILGCALAKRAESRKSCRGVIDRLAGRGIRGRDLGCTELGTIYSRRILRSIFDYDRHCRKRRAVELALVLTFPAVRRRI